MSIPNNFLFCYTRFYVHIDIFSKISSILFQILIRNSAIIRYLIFSIPSGKLQKAIFYFLIFSSRNKLDPKNIKSTGQNIPRCFFLCSNLYLSRTMFSRLLTSTPMYHLSLRDFQNAGPPEPHMLRSCQWSPSPDCPAWNHPYNLPVHNTEPADRAASSAPSPCFP